MHWLIGSAAVAASLASSAHAVPQNFPRTEVNASQLLPSYDYVVVGGGVSGLVVAHRLSEDKSKTVLIIEAGSLDQREDFVTIPGLAGGAVGTKYDWNVSYIPNPEAGVPAVPVPIGKVVGGGSVLNRMLYARGTKADYDRWGALIDSSWSWSSLLTYFKKAETFTPPSKDIVAKYNVTYDPSVDGHKGPVKVSYSPWFWPSSKIFKDAIQQLGISISKDINAGTSVGGCWFTHAQDPKTQTRSSARTAYWDTAASRPNLHLLTNHQVTKLLTQNTTVYGVEFAASAGAQRKTINATVETILAAGALHTPQVLQLSGIGDSALLSKLNIPIVADLPGVGQNLQDHPYITLVTSVQLPLSSNNLTSNASFAAAALAEYNSKRTGPYSTATGDFIAFLPAVNYTNQTSTLSTAATAQDPSAYLDPSTPASVQKGYAAQHASLAAALTDPTGTGWLEVIYGDGAVVLTLLHPFSRGFATINSTDAFAAPVLDVRFLANPIDASLLVEALKWARYKFNQTPAVSALAPVELVPGASVSSDADLEAFVRGGVSTLYHPVGTAKLGAKEDGGVVGSDFKVYGVQRLRVVDASTMPDLPGMHTQATVYAVAERAAEEIKKGVKA